jgi:hypothetical protein
MQGKEKTKDKDEACSLLSSTLVSKEEQKTTTNVAFILIFYCNFIRTIQDENECNTCNCLLCKGTRVKNKQRKKKVDVHLFAIDAHVIFWSNVFCNTTATTSSAFYNIVFCNIISTLFLFLNGGEV